MGFVLALLTDVLGVIEAALALAFLSAAVGKLSSLSEFRRSVRVLPLMAHGTDWLVAVVVPALELGIAAGLILGAHWAAGASVALLLVFSLVAFYAVRLRLSVPCNCFGAHSGRLSVGTIRRNMLLAALALLLLLRPEVLLSSQEIVCGLVAVCFGLTGTRMRLAHESIKELASIGGVPPQFGRTKRIWRLGFF